jgi:hypothetical protein
MRTYLEHLTDAQLTTRLADIETVGKAAAARVAAGDRGEPRGSRVVNGQHVQTYANESALNVLRYAWQQTRAELRQRATN